MARKIIPVESVNQQKPKLDELIPLYGEQNTQFNALKKVVADLNTKLKTAIHDAQQENKDITVSGWKCKLTVSDNSTLNEDKLIEVAKKHNIPIVKTKEYIDFDILENLIYHQQISQELMLEINKCKDVAVKETLRITKEKTDGDNN